MREMKDSGIEWIPSIPKNWTIQRLKYIVDSFAKGNGITKEDVLFNGDTPCVRYGEIYSKYDYSFTDCISRTNKDRISSQQYFSYGDILFAGTGEMIEEIGMNIVYLGNEQCLAGGDIIIAKHSQNPSFLNYALNSNYVQSQKGVGKAKLKVVHISAFNLGNLMVALPPIVEQKRIANFLDKECSEIDSLISDIQSQIETLEEYKKSLVFHVVSTGIKNTALKETVSKVWMKIPENWKLVDIKYVFEIVKRIAGQEGVDVLSVTQKGLKVKDIESNNGQQAESYAGYQFVYPTDYVMNHMDLLTGWVDCSTTFGVTSPDYRVFRLRDKENNDLTYFKYLTQCCYMCRIFYSLGQGVSNLGRWRLQTSAFNNFMIPIPPLEEQKEIADYLDNKITEIDSIISERQQQIKTMEEYKKSLIFEYVTGKREVPNVAF